ncbi:MAG: hypothetical protein HW419_4424 [Deltaproteobacteria bacterium]|nr:hypothetical protein [Deltaproteobacteria bacterium]
MRWESEKKIGRKERKVRKKHSMRSEYFPQSMS